MNTPLPTPAESLAAVIRRAAVACIAQLEREAREARKGRDTELAQQLERDADEIRARAAR